MSNLPPNTLTNEDPLLAELNGALARTGEPTPVVGDRFGAQPPTLESQLETAPAAAPKHTPRADQLDKLHSKKAGGFGYRVVVEGIYFAKSAEAKGNVLKPYSLPFNLPDLKNSKGEAALGIIIGASRPGGGMLKAALVKMDPMAITYKTHSITSVTALQGAPEPTSFMYMSMEALKAHVRQDPKFQDYPIKDLDEYVNVEHLREDIIDFKTNEVTDVVDQAGNHTKGGFGLKKTPSDRILERHAARKEENELAAMNPGVM